MILDSDDAATFTATRQVVLVKPGFRQVGLSKTGGGQYRVQRRDDNDVRVDSEPMSFADAVAAPEIIPPADWTALTGACETCDGNGIDPGPEYNQSDDCLLSDLDDDEWRDMFPCPSCGGTGRKRFTVVTACQQGLIVADGWDHSWCGRTNTEPIPCDDGTVMLGTATAELVQIVAVQAEAPDFECIEIVTHGPQHRTALRHIRDGRMRSTFIDIGPDPASKIGQWALIITKAEQP